MVKKKKTDRDKYFNLAKAQGYRARSAFKLIQLNKKFDFLSTASVCIDLCAAPGGWCQVAQKCMPAMSTIIGIDLLPIRPMRGVKTFQCDITTPLCRQLIKKECKGQHNADVVLCDGAPNVGANYTKDAYVQNELALKAMQLAIDVLKPGGWFVSKVFRSQDYNALMWVFKQLFKRVQANKPASSRNESAEIFVVCEGYFAPDRIDPKMLDPKHVFQQVEAPQKAVSIFHKKFGQQKRNRAGYDDDLNATMTRTRSALDFIRARDPIALLSISHVLVFGPDCEELLSHPATTEEVKTCCADLRIIGKADFKALLKWREVILQSIPGDSNDTESIRTSKLEEPAQNLTPEQLERLAERKLDDELADLRSSEAQKQRRLKKKEARKRAKLRERVALGMDQAGTSVDVEQEGVFSLATSKDVSKKALQVVRNGAMTQTGLDIADRGAEDAEWEDAFDDAGMEEMEDAEEGDSEDDNHRTSDLMLDRMYAEYQDRLGGTSQALKREARRSHVKKAAQMSEALMTQSAMHDNDMQRYLDQLGSGGSKKHRPDEADEGQNDEDSSSSSSEDEAEAEANEQRGSDIHDIDNAGVSGAGEIAAARWVDSHPLLAKVDEEEEERMLDARLGTPAQDDADVAMNASSSSDNDDGDKHMSRAAQEVLAAMPKTDKQKRHEARVKLMARQERRASRKREREEQEEAEGFTIVGPDSAQHAVDEDPKTAKHRQMIEAGMGATLAREAAAKAGGNGFEVVNAATESSRYEFPAHYDDEDIARSLTVGHMMLNKSKRRKMIDASYNRYAWDDPEGLPAWFLDDQERHNKPQMELPADVLVQMRERVAQMANRPIAKVAEARARKAKRAQQKLKAAKKRAEAIANQEDMSANDKKRAIDKAMKGAKIDRPSKVYVVSRRGGKSQANSKQQGGKVKLVDPRMKADQRMLKKREKAKQKKNRRKKNK